MEADHGPRLGGVDLLKWTSVVFSPPACPVSPTMRTNTRTESDTLAQDGNALIFQQTIIIPQKPPSLSRSVHPLDVSCIIGHGIMSGYIVYGQTACFLALGFVLQR
ncbi:hypothetical protein LZ30DRAFT_780117 [Colletotrichum cereale]|nr:hypothetical protein LZ30DRAFT_780117 [Colletotrichum cereale]